MQNEKKYIISEELKVSQKTGDDIFSLDSEEPTHIYTKDNSINEVNTDSGPAAALTPMDISKKKYYNSEKKKNDAKTAVLNMLKYLIPIFFSLLVGLLSIFGVIWAYKLNNIAEPIGGIKAEIKNLKNNNNEIKLDINKLENRINNYLEKSIK